MPHPACAREVQREDRSFVQGPLNATRIPRVRGATFPTVVILTMVAHPHPARARCEVQCDPMRDPFCPASPQSSFAIVSRSRSTGDGGTKSGHDHINVNTGTRIPRGATSF